MIEDLDEPGQGLKPDVEYVGPFESHRVVVDGWEVPLDYRRKACLFVLFLPAASKARRSISR